MDLLRLWDTQINSQICKFRQNNNFLVKFFRLQISLKNVNNVFLNVFFKENLRQSAQPCDYVWLPVMKKEWQQVKQEDYSSLTDLTESLYHMLTVLTEHFGVKHTAFAKAHCYIYKLHEPDPERMFDCDCGTNAYV